MADLQWKPNATVAAIGERDNCYLLVREQVDDRVVFNQPAGHLELGETLLEAVIRETREETGYRFEPSALQGIYRYRPDVNADRTYLRFLFRGRFGERFVGDLDQGIIAAEWLSYEEVVACRDQHRSPMVLQCINDYRRGPGYPLELISREFA